MFHRSRFLVWSLVLLLACAIGALAAGRLGRQKPVADLEIGAPVPDFALKNLENRVVSLQQWRGKVVALTFWASWCPACRSEMPSLEALHNRLEGEGVVVLGVNGGEPVEKVRAFLSEMQLTFPVVVDPKGEVHDLYGVRQYPVTFILDREGRLVGRHLGARDWSSPPVIDYFRSLAGNRTEGMP